MNVAALFFYLFSAVMIASAFMVIAARNPVHSVLFLILAFFNAAGLFLLLGAEFLAMILRRRLCRRGRGPVPLRRHDARRRLHRVQAGLPAISADRRHDRRHRAVRARSSSSAPGPSPPVRSPMSRRRCRPACRIRWRSAASSTPNMSICSRPSGLVLLTAMIGAIVLTLAPQGRASSARTSRCRTRGHRPRRSRSARCDSRQGV